MNIFFTICKGCAWGLIAKTRTCATTMTHTHMLSVESPLSTFTKNSIKSNFTYQRVKVERKDNKVVARTVNENYEFLTDTNVPRLGVMLVGWGGNNGTTLTSTILANRKGLKWQTKQGIQEANYFGSMVMASTVRLGVEGSRENEFVHVPMNSMIPMVDPNDIVLGGWDISSANLAEAVDRACVLEPDLKSQLYDELKEMKPLPSMYYPDYIALNQEDRANNILKGSKQEHLETIQRNIRDFKAKNQLEKVIVLWTANTERFSNIIVGVNDTKENLLAAIASGHSEVAPSTIFGVASVLEGVPFINGSPQNTFVPGLIELALYHKVHIGGDDFKTGQTKFKSVLVDFLVNAGIKPLAITSYNHLGNNDGKNLSQEEQFKSKEVSKKNVVDDMVQANHILFKKGEYPDHTIVIKYTPSVGDSKRALDEYENEICMGGRNTISVHNTCEDSLLATPIMIDLILLMELFTRVTYKTPDVDSFKPFNPIMSILSYMLKAPMVPEYSPVINSLSRQRNCIENMLRVLVVTPMKKRVGILGATGIVGQRFIQLLQNHSMFIIHKLGASPQSSGRKYSDAVENRWMMEIPIPQELYAMNLLECKPDNFKDCDLVFSALDTDVALSIETDFHENCIPIFSNASAFRMSESVPLVVPLCNPEHLELCKYQKAPLVTNANCSTTGLVTVLKPLDEAFQIKNVIVCTMQAISGAGYPGVASLAIFDNVIPYIKNEEEKLITESKKILGKLSAGKVEHSDLKVSASCHRVPVIDGHLLSVHVEFNIKPDVHQVKRILMDYFPALNGVDIRNAPSFPDKPIVVMDEANRPQTRLDRMNGNGMSVTVGRIRKCQIFDIQFECLSHNTILGAAGSSILNAEIFSMMNKDK